MSFSFGHPSCELALRCIWVPNLRTCLALHWGAQLADLRTCLPFALRTCVRTPNFRTSLALRKVYLQAKICSYPSSSSSFSLVLPCVDVFVADEFFIWAPILRTCLDLRLGTQLADVPCIALGGPTCGCADVPSICVADVRSGTQLADVPCVALRRPNLVRLY